MFPSIRSYLTLKYVRYEDFMNMKGAYNHTLSGYITMIDARFTSNMQADSGGISPRLKLSPVFSC